MAAGGLKQGQAFCCCWLWVQAAMKCCYCRCVGKLLQLPEGLCRLGSIAVACCSVVWGQHPVHATM